MLGEDTYGLAMEPSTNRDAGRWDARERGELGELAPGEAGPTTSRSGAFGAAEIDRFADRVAALGPAPA